MFWWESLSLQRFLNSPLPTQRGIFLNAWSDSLSNLLRQPAQPAPFLLNAEVLTKVKVLFILNGESLSPFSFPLFWSDQKHLWQLEVSSSFNDPTSVNCFKWVSKWHKIAAVLPPLCVFSGHFGIRHTWAHPPLSFWGIKLVYFQRAEAYLASIAFFFSLQQWFHWDQFVHITSLPFF